MKKFTSLLLSLAIFLSLGVISQAAVIDNAIEKAFFMTDSNYVYLLEETLVAEINNDTIKVYNADGTAAGASQFAGTGMICRSYDYSKTIILMGDVNCDGRVTAADARAALRMAAKIDDKNKSYNALAAHTEYFTENGEVKARDARFILRCAAGLEDFDHFEGIKAEKEKNESKNEPKYAKNSLLITVKKTDSKDMSWVKELVGCAYYKKLTSLTDFNATKVYRLNLNSYDNFSLNKVIDALDDDNRVLLIEKDYVVKSK